MRLSLLTALAAAVALVAGCPGISDIDRTQPDKVKKSLFQNADGSPKEFYFRQTIIDVPATNGVTFIGEQGEMERVVFEVTENFLYAYRSYGYLANQDGGILDGNQGDGYVRPGTGAYQGAPLAAFAIQSHFDVKRQYNPSTGEQTNVVYEDTQDRVWNKRDYMRVDWSTNHIADFRFGSATALQTPASRFIPEIDNSTDVKDRPVLTDDYIDIVTEMNVEPESMDLSAYGYGMVPECYFSYGAYKDCMGGTIKVRSSFLPIDKLPRYADINNGYKLGARSDYMPQPYDDVRFQRFGFFRTERYQYDDQYGVVEPAQIRLANRWNLWGDAQSCYDAQADKPYANCSPDQLRPIVYYMNDDFPKDPADLKAMALQNADSWNELFREGIKASTGWDDAKLGDRRLFIMCPNNPVLEGDPAECGPAGTNPQIGDLRYSMYYYIPNFQFSPPLGYGPSAADPLTGEIIQGNAFYYGAAGATIAARTIDILKLQMGIVTEDDISGGLPAQQAVAAANAAQQASRASNLRFRGADIGDKAREMVRNMGLAHKAERLRAQIDSGAATVDKRQMRAARLRTSGIDDLVVNDEMREVFTGILLKDKSVAPADADAALASRLFDNDLLFSREQERRKRLQLTPSKTCILSAEDVFDDALLGLLRKVKSKFYDTATTPPSLKPGFTDKDVYNYMLAQTLGDTQLHEVGHTMGLRHNFAGSTDALNFGPTYWDLRGTVRAPNAPRPLPEWKVAGPAQASLDIAIEEGLRDNQDASIMDYASTYGTATELGMYDRAAIKYAYFDTLEVFNAAEVTPERAAFLVPGEVHYTRYPEVVSDAGSFEDRVASMYDRGDLNFRKVPELRDAVAGDKIEVPYSFCSDEYRDASATCAVWDQGADNYERSQYGAEHYRNYRLFSTFKRERLTFGLDIYSYLSRVYTSDFSYLLNEYKNWVNDELIIRTGRPCNVVENGAIVKEADSRFAADSCGLAGFLGTVETVNLMAEVIAQPDVGCYARLKPGCYDTVAGNGSDARPADDADITLVDADPSKCDDVDGNPATVDPYTPTQPDPNDNNASARIALKVTSKTPYSHVPDSTSCEGYTPPVAALFETPVELGNGPARAANTLYDRDRYGYYFYNKPIVIGSWWDKWLAVKAIGDGQTDFIGVDASSDTRSFLISLNTLFGDDLNSLVGATVTDDVARYGNVVRNGTAEVVPLLDVNTGGAVDRDTVDAAPINPDQQYTVRLIAMFNAAYNGQTTDDFEFAETLSVGGSYAPETYIDAAIRNDASLYTQLRDPVTGMTWYAVKQDRPGSNTFYSVAFDFIREIKARYYVGGADGPGEQLLPAYVERNIFEPRQDIEILRIMATSAAVFGNADVWSGDLEF